MYEMRLRIAVTYMNHLVVECLMALCIEPNTLHPCRHQEQNNDNHHQRQGVLHLISVTLCEDLGTVQ